MALIMRLVGALLLGFGTVFGLKGEADVHWSESPELSIAVLDAVDADSGQPT